MTKFELEISSGNAAFNDGGCWAAMEECARILKEVTAKLESGHEDGFCIDINGNKVGKWHLDTEDDE